MKKNKQSIKGFTLLELMVVVTIVAIATAVISLTIPDNEQTSVEKEAQRLSAILESARSQARIIGTDVEWKPTGTGFEFIGLEGKNELRHQWLDRDDSFTIQMFNRDKPIQSINLGPEPMIAPQKIELTLGKYTARIKTDGLEPFDYEIINQQ